MRQPSLHEVLGVVRKCESTAPSGILEVYDFFASAGGFSEGARQAGCRVVWVCDNDPVALRTHAANHPHAVHCLVDLPMPRSELPFPKDGRRFHAHFSPPCQKFSNVNKTRRVAGDCKEAAELIEWSIETALSSGAASWSLEQVATDHVIRIVERARARHPRRVAYAKLDLSLLGVPQKRVRLIAGPPPLVARLLRLCSASKMRSVRSVISYPRGTHIRNGLGWKRKYRGRGNRWCYVKAGWGDNCSPIDGPSPTVLSDRGLNWVTHTSTGVHASHPRLVAREYAALQTFRCTYRWPDTQQLALKQIGNAVPPLVAQLLMQGAIDTHAAHAAHSGPGNAVPPLVMQLLLSTDDDDTARAAARVASSSDAESPSLRRMHAPV